MDENQKQNGGDENPGRNSDETIRGRTHNSQDPAVKQSGTENDISSVDQQEGDMKHGEAGGNFVEQQNQ